MEETRLWQALDTHKGSWQATATCMSGLNRIHVRCARLLGLDAPTKLDVSSIYQRGGSDLEAEQQAREAVIEALPIEERRRIYELFYPGRSTGRRRRPISTRHRHHSEQWTRQQNH
jgi:hypothetical protein